MTSAVAVLILDGHTNQALACVRSLGRAGYRALVASHRRSPLAAWSRYCRSCFRLRGETIEAYAEARSWAHKQGVTIVLPLTERACVLCNAERQRWEECGTTVGCGLDEMLRGAFDKALTLCRAEACGVSIPPTYSPMSFQECRAAADAVGFPCVVKPRWSNAWDGTSFLPTHSPSYVNTSGDFDIAVLSLKQGDYWPLIQGFVPGQGRGVFALCDHGRAVAWFAHERLRDVKPTGSGSSLRRSIPLEPRLREPAERLLSELEWHGPAMVEFRDDGIHPPCLMEVNGRFWGSLQLSIDAGTDFPNLWVSILNGKSIEPSVTYTEGLTLRWLCGDVKRFLYILGGPPPGYPGSYPTWWQGVRELLGAQPSGTRLETWRKDDAWPVVGELVSGLHEILVRL
jgi:predicted ATP-grasp superfamily ATP-dependent carboligase